MSITKVTSADTRVSIALCTESGLRLPMLTPESPLLCVQNLA